MSRAGIYYWKCDRPAAFHGTQEHREPDAAMAGQLREAIAARFPSARIEIAPALSQGNHLTWNVDLDGARCFARVEHGPEGDDHLELESALMARVAGTGVPVPAILAVDASRRSVPFAWQLMERISYPDLNHWHKSGALQVDAISSEIGTAVARWQSIQPLSFGPFATPEKCYHANYADYFFLRLTEHLDFLVKREVLKPAHVDTITTVINDHKDLLSLASPCLVHKDLALWNILGGPDHIAAFIDFDDAIGGDPMDDFSLLACFHDAEFLQAALRGYEKIRPLPDDYLRRLWLHLLRNMIVKAVIRTGAGYFDRDDSFFLIGSGSTGADLRRATLQRIDFAWRALDLELDLSHL